MESDPFERQSRSAVWKYFRRDLKAQKVECLLCGMKLVYKVSSTTSFHSHLANKHKARARETEKGGPVLENPSA